MNIAFLTSFPLDVGIGSGVVRMLMAYRQAMEQAGHRSSIIHPRYGSCNSLQTANRRLKFNRQLRKTDLSGYDLVIGSDFDGYALSDEQAKNLVVLNGGILADLLQFEKGRDEKILGHLAAREKQNVQRAQKVFVPSVYTAEKVCEYYKVDSDKIVVAPLGIDFENWTSAIQKAQPVKKSCRIILCVAKQYPRKGIADLIKAFAEVHRKKTDVRLQIVGGGPQAAANIELAESLDLGPAVSFAGDVRNFQSLAEYYRNGDIFCLPSYHETFGLVFLEAMCAGLPVVSYRSTAIPEVVQETQGFLCTPGNIGELSERLLFLLDNGQQAAKMAEAGIKRAKSLTWAESARKIIANQPHPL